MKPKLKHPLCRATLKDGMPCQSVAVEDGMCKPHAKKAREAAAVAEEIRATAHRESPVDPPSEKKSVGAADSGSEEVPAAAEPTATGERIESIRGALREGLLTEEVSASIQDLLLDGLRASKDVYSSCPHCGKRHPVSLPDLNTRVSAARAVLEEVEGRTKQITETTDQKLEALRQNAGKDLASCTDEELTLLLFDTNDGELPSAKQAAQKLARELLADRDTRKKPRHWLREKLTEPEFDLLSRIAFESQNGWAGFGDQLYETAALVVVDAEASA